MVNGEISSEPHILVAFSRPSGDSPFVNGSGREYLAVQRFVTTEARWNLQHTGGETEETGAQQGRKEDGEVRRKAYSADKRAHKSREAALVNLGTGWERRGTLVERVAC